MTREATEREKIMADLLASGLSHDTAMHATENFYGEVDETFVHQLARTSRAEMLSRLNICNLSDLLFAILEQSTEVGIIRPPQLRWQNSR